MKEEVYLTTLDMMLTYGFFKVITIIWTPLFLVLLALFIYKRYYKGGE